MKNKRLWYVPSLWESPIRVVVLRTEFFNGSPIFYECKSVHDGRYIKDYANKFATRAFRFSMC